MVSDLETNAYEECKIAAQKSLFFGKFCPTIRIFLVLVLLSASVKRCFDSRMRKFYLVLVYHNKVVVIKPNVMFNLKVDFFTKSHTFRYPIFKKIFKLNDFFKSYSDVK